MRILDLNTFSGDASAAAPSGFRTVPVLIEAERLHRIKSLGWGSTPAAGECRQGLLGWILNDAEIQEQRVA